MPSQNRPKGAHLSFHHKRIQWEGGTPFKNQQTAPQRIPSLQCLGLPRLLKHTKQISAIYKLPKKPRYFAVAVQNKSDYRKQIV